MAGNLINMMSISLREPYLFDLPIGASASGYLYQRIYPNWDERRGGGSFSLGRQLGTSIYADFAVRAEEVDFFGYRSPAPADYLAASGFTSLVSLKPSHSMGQPQQPVHADQGPVYAALHRAGLWQLYLDQVRRRGTDVSADLQPPGRHRQAVLHLAQATSGSPPKRTPIYERYFAGNFGQPSRVLVSHGQSACLRRSDRRHHDGRGLGRVPVSLERP